MLGMGTFLWCLAETCSYLSFRYFNLPAWKILRHLPIEAGDDYSRESAWTYIKAFFPKRAYGFFFVVGFSLCLWLNFATRNHPVWHLMAAVVVVAASFAVARWWSRPQLRFSEVEAGFIGLDQMQHQSRLKQMQRVISMQHPTPDIRAAKNVILIINESAGANAAASQGGNRLLSEELVDLAGDPERWVVFQEALTASTCTDISIPCLLTGCAPQQGASRLHHLPTVFEVAKAGGLKTLLVTSCSLQWANFDQFFSLDSIDEMLGPLGRNYPLVNELNCDDILVVEDLCTQLRQTTDPVCVVVYLNSLHIPFQAESKLEIPATLVGRRQRATYIAERSHQMIFDALKDSGRYDSSLIFSVGDHGENAQEAEETIGNLSRLTQLGAEVVRPLFLTRCPDLVPAIHRDALAANANSLTSLIDIVPTVARFLGIQLSSESVSDGFDLFEPVPASRIHYTLNVNEWRSWPQSAVMIAHERFKVCIDYQSFEHCCVDEHGLPFKLLNVSRKEELLRNALAEPLVQKAISRVLSDKLAGRA